MLPKSQHNWRHTSSQPVDQKKRSTLLRRRTFHAGFDVCEEEPWCRIGHARQLVVEFGEKVHHRNNVKGENARNKMDGRWHEGYYLGMHWRTGSAWIGTSAGVIKASVIRRTRAHRRWDQDGVLGVRGTPWNRVPAAEGEYPETIIEPLPEAERRAVPPSEDQRRLLTRIMLRSTSSSMGSQRNVLDVACFCLERLKGKENGKGARRNSIRES